ncbi:MAG: ABC transporter ATP-binding protein/permease [Alphaproteobacteria bacterium]|nr:ABC transporter ATP-binding protein/permease [Alphaproteobacteria bacterium]
MKPESSEAAPGHGLHPNANHGRIRAHTPFIPMVPRAPRLPGPSNHAPSDLAQSTDFDIARDVALFRRTLWRAPGCGHVTAIFLVWSVLTIANMFGQVRLNEWNGAFFDAIGNKQLANFVHQLWTFVAIVAGLLTVTVGQTYLQERLKFRVRELVTRHLLAEWLKPMRVYQLAFAGGPAQNPDQRIQEDTRLLSDLSVDQFCGLFFATAQVVAFTGVLWVLSAQVSFQVGGYHVAIPGYMVWCALIYALIGSSLTWIVGRPLIRLNAIRYAREAEFRFALVRTTESGESIALHKGEADERRYLERELANVVEAMRRLASSLAHLTWITSGTGWLTLVVPVLVAAPAYFNGSLTLGGLIMVSGAFSQVQWAMRWFVDNFPRLAEWRAAAHRVARFRESLDHLPAIEEGTPEIEIAEHPDGWLSFEDVTILLPDGHIVIEDANVTISPGDRVLIVGETGSGKSTLFRAVAGLWPWGSGRIRIPRPDSMAFLPQRPYLPLGTLRNAVVYPRAPQDVPDDEVRRALERCDLGQFLDRLDTEERWDRELSLGEQERLAFARLLIHKPRWVFLDEATAALDGDSQRHIMRLFDDELKGATVLSIGHRPDLAEYHTRTIQLLHGKEGAQLQFKATLKPNMPRVDNRGR